MAHLGWSGHPSAEGRAVPHVPVGTERGWGPRPSLLSGHSRVFAALNRGRANPCQASEGADGKPALAES